MWHQYLKVQIQPLNVGEIMIQKGQTGHQRDEELEQVDHPPPCILTVQYCVNPPCISIYLSLQPTAWAAYRSTERPSIHLRHKRASNSAMCSLAGFFYWPFSSISMRRIYLAFHIHVPQLLFSTGAVEKSQYTCEKSEFHCRAQLFIKASWRPLPGMQKSRGIFHLH